MDRAKQSTRPVGLLSQLLLRSAEGMSSLPEDLPIGRDFIGDFVQALGRFDQHSFADLWQLASSHHVIMRAFPGLQREIAARSSNKAEWIAQGIFKEQTRIDHALCFLSHICEALREAGDVVVMKSLDHWPDLGSDLDLFTNAEAADVAALMHDRFKARPDERSWGDRLANKWNFIVPGLPELVEVHISRLGQTGEQVAITQSLVARAGIATFGNHSFNVPAPEDRIVISTLQRMYRHFYLRLCDVVDNARLVDAGVVDYGYLKTLGDSAGLWKGLATYLVILSGYVESYRGEALPLPALVTEAARFGNDCVRFKRNFLRIPLFPQSAGLYASEWKTLLLNKDIQSALRLSLLPGLATMAALELKLTGSDKGIW